MEYRCNGLQCKIGSIGKRLSCLSDQGWSGDDDDDDDDDDEPSEDTNAG